jgi:tetratricopeptide (TPR) repeat protein
MNALEWGLVNHQTIGKVLISQNLVSQTLLDAALSLQKMVDQENFEAAKASECLARIHGSGIALEEALAEIREEKVAKDGEVTYEKLLMLARVVSEDDLEAAFDISAQSATVIGKILVLTGHMDVPTLQATLRCYQLFSRGLLSQDDAVVTLDYSLHQNSEGPIKFDDALKELGWNKDRGLRLKGEPTPVVEVQPTLAAPAGEKVAAAENATSAISATSTTAQGADTTPADSATKTAEVAAVNVNAQAVIISPESQPDIEEPENIPELPADQSVSDIGLSADDDSEDGESEGEVGSESDGDNKPNAKAKKHSQTIQPEDARASRLATLMQGHKQGDRDILANFDPTNDPPDALHKVFERLAASYFTRGNYTQAQVIYERILVHRLNQVGASDTALVADFNNLAGVLVAQEKYNQAEPFMRRAVSILDVAKEVEPLKVAEALSLLATIYMRQNKLAESEPLVKRALGIRRANLSAEHPDVAQTLSDYAKLLRKMQREEEAETMYKEALVILSKIEEEQNEQEANEALDTNEATESSESMEAAAQE